MREGDGSASMCADRKITGPRKDDPARGEPRGPGEEPEDVGTAAARNDHAHDELLLALGKMLAHTTSKEDQK